MHNEDRDQIPRRVKRNCSENNFITPSLTLPPRGEGLGGRAFSSLKDIDALMKHYLENNPRYYPLPVRERARVRGRAVMFTPTQSSSMKGEDDR